MSPSRPPWCKQSEWVFSTQEPHLSSASYPVVLITTLLVRAETAEKEGGEEKGRALSRQGCSWWSFISFTKTFAYGKQKQQKHFTWCDTAAPQSPAPHHTNSVHTGDSSTAHWCPVLPGWSCCPRNRDIGMCRLAHGISQQKQDLVPWATHRCWHVAFSPLTPVRWGGSEWQGQLAGTRRSWEVA